MTSERGRDREQGYPEGRGKKWFPERMSDPPCQRLLKGGGRQRESGMRGVQEAGVMELRKGLRMLRVRRMECGWCPSVWFGQMGGKRHREHTGSLKKEQRGTYGNGEVSFGQAGARCLWNGIRIT